MGPTQKLKNIKESIKETLHIIKVCFTTIWFWIPALLALYMILQLWIMFFIHTLALLIVPTILIIYLIIQEDKRLKAMYGLETAKKKKASDPMFSGPTEISGYQWDVEKAVENYQKTLKKASAKNEKEEKS